MKRCLCRKYVGLGSIGVGWCLLVASAAPQARTNPPDPCAQQEVKSVGGGLVAFGDGQLLVWSSGGDAQIRRKDGGWTVPGRIPVSDIREAIADSEGALLVRAKDPQEVVLIDAAGARKQSWRPRSETGAAPSPLVSVFSAGKGRWLVTGTALIPLLEQSKFGPPVPLPSTFAGVGVRKSSSPAPPPDVLAFDERSLLACLRRLTSKEGYGNGLCERTGALAWRATNHFEGKSVLCGNWIVHVGQDRLAARAVETGAVIKEVRSPGGADRAVACAGTDKVVVGGGKTLTVLSLPDLRVLSEQKLRSGRVASVAFTGDLIAFATQGGSTVRLLSPSCAVAPQAAGAASAKVRERCRPSQRPGPGAPHCIPPGEDEGPAAF